MDDPNVCPEHNLPAFVVLSRKPGANAYIGVTEQSWCMDRDESRVLICWSHKGTSSGLLNALLGSTIEFQVDGERQARNIAEKNQRGDEELLVFDVLDPELPIVIDWAAWNADNEPVADTLSGVRNKYKARNAPFVMKEG